MLLTARTVHPMGRDSLLSRSDESSSIVSVRCAGDGIGAGAKHLELSAALMFPALICTTAHQGRGDNPKLLANRLAGTVIIVFTDRILFAGVAVDHTTNAHTAPGPGGTAVFDR